jgi:hypothetical protein
MVTAKIIDVQIEHVLELYIHSPNTPSWRGAQLKKKTQDKSSLYLTVA